MLRRFLIAAERQSKGERSRVSRTEPGREDHEAEKPVQRRAVVDAVRRDEGRVQSVPRQDRKGLREIAEVAVVEGERPPWPVVSPAAQVVHDLVQRDDPVGRARYAHRRISVRETARPGSRHRCVPSATVMTE